LKSAPKVKIAEKVQRILIVDDDRRGRELLEVMLGSLGFVLLSAASGEEALEVVAAQPPDLILLDVTLPVMNGYEVTAVIKGNVATKSIPIIIVTALDDRDDRIRGLTAGAEDFLTKPVDRVELTARVRNLLRLKAYGDYHDKYGQMLEGEVDSRTADLIESELLYRSTFDAAPVGVVNVGLDGEWLRVNQRLCDLLGYTREELQTSAIRKSVESAEEEAPGEAAAVRQMVAGTLDRHVIDERRYRRKDGEVVWARVYISLHRGAEGQAQHFIWVIEDITDRRRLESQVRQANKMDAIGGLAAGVAHDFNNLLSIVLSYSELLAEDLKEGDPMRADLDEIKGAGQRAVALTRQLLAFSRQQVLQPKIVDLGEIVSGMEKMLRRLIGEDMDLTAIGTLGLGRVLVDPGQVEQVILNLAVNARDAMPSGGKLTIETKLVVLDEAHTSQHAGMKPGPHVMLAVSDTGVGMDKATQARIFEPFFTTKPSGKGTGLGLATVFGIVRQSGGMVWVYSEPGKGTTFKVYFPTTDRAAVHKSAPPGAERATLYGSETVLLVEDEESVRVLARTILRKYGYEVLEAQSGGDAFLLCEQHGATIHLLLTDVVMPRMSGRQLAERLKPLRPEMKVLYMSGYTDDAVMRHGILESTVAFLQKPITPDRLAVKVREVLDVPRV
jgi:two-component system, cell cycle sensor histidine kinase and response regulator CckA